MNANLQIKMDLSDIIFYIVFAIVGILGSTIQNKGKKKAAKTPQKREENNTTDERNIPSPQEEYIEENTFDDDMEDDYIDDEIEEVEPRSVEHTLDEIFRALREGTPLTPNTPSQPLPQENEIVTQQQESAEFTQPPIMINNEGEPAILHISGDEISDSNIYSDMDNNDADDTRFNPQEVDWRQAVITHEILTRKY